VGVAERLSRLRGQLLHKDKAAVRGLLGQPLKIGYWTTTNPPQGASAAASAAFRASTLDEIWIYASGRVHFTLAGSAARVDDKTRLDLPPPQNLV
jgi:hypothetical protein